ncbi:MAG: nuclear transport factor 2 family protein [Gemmatimonadales bacterium]
MDAFRRNNEAVSRGDIEAALATLDPDIEFIPRRAAVQGVYRGYEGMRQFFAENADNFDLYHVSYQEVRDLGDRLIAFGTVHARGKESGAEVTTPTAMVATFRDGKMLRAEDFAERSEALKAAGLEE